MTPETQIILWVLGGCTGTISLGVLAHISVVQRIARLETVFELMGGKALKKMHSPTDHLGLDGLIEKYAVQHDLEMHEWIIIRDVCDQEIHRLAKTHDAPNWALMAWGLAVHKLQRYGIKSDKTKS